MIAPLFSSVKTYIAKNINDSDSLSVALGTTIKPQWILRGNVCRFSGNPSFDWRRRQPDNLSARILSLCENRSGKQTKACSQAIKLCAA